MSFATGILIVRHFVRSLPWLISLERTQLALGDVIDGASAPTVGGAEAANCTVDSTEGVGWAIYAIGGMGVVVVPTLSGDAEADDEIWIDLVIAPDAGDVFTVRATVEVDA